MFRQKDSVVVPAGDAAGLARYLMRSPVSLERLSWDEGTGEIVYVAKLSHGHDVAADLRHEQRLPEERFDPLEFIARLVLHIAEPKRHLIRYFGAYASIVRARRRSQAPAEHLLAATSRPPAPPTDHPPAP